MDPAFESGVAARLRDALLAACRPRAGAGASVGAVPEPLLAVPLPLPRVLWDVVLTARESEPLPDAASGDAAALDAGAVADAQLLVATLFREEGSSLVRLARLFVDDRNAAEDLVQEAFIRLARSAHRIRDPLKAPAYLRSIVLNLARDSNRRGLVSLRHNLPFDETRAATEDSIDLRDDQQEVIDALREIPRRQRDCLVLRYYDELGIDEIAELLGISRNSVKTHLTRGLTGLRGALGAGGELDTEPAGAVP